MKRLLTVLSAFFVLAVVGCSSSDNKATTPPDSTVKVVEAKPAEEIKDTTSSLPNIKQVDAAMIVISKESMTLAVYDFRSQLLAAYPIACGKAYGNKERRGDMKTPEGAFYVQQIQDAGAWTHDFGDGKGEIKGAYGSHFIRLYTPGHSRIGIHGTHDPASIGTRATEGCIRLHNENLLDLVKYVYVGMPVIITPSEKDCEVPYKMPEAAKKGPKITK